MNVAWAKYIEEDAQGAESLTLTVNQKWPLAGPEQASEPTWWRHVHENTRKCSEPGRRGVEKTICYKTPKNGLLRFRAASSTF